MPERDYSAKKEITYTIEEVEGTNDDYLKIKSEYEEYFEGIKEKVNNKDFDEKLVGTDKLVDIADKYNYEVVEYLVGMGDGGNEEVSRKNINLVYNDILYHFYYSVPYYNVISYELSIDQMIENASENMIRKTIKTIEKGV